MATAPHPIADSTAGKPPRPRRRIPLSVKLFLSLLLLVGVGSALWVGIHAYRQRVAIKDIERFHGLVSRVPVTQDTFSGLVAADAASGEDNGSQDGSPPDWFVRPIQLRGAPAEVLADLGVKVMAFEYRAPLAHKVTITFAARDENGEVITELAEHSRRIAFRDFDLHGTVRLTLVDPATFIEKDDGRRVHWIMKFGMVGGEFSGSAWTRNPFRLEAGAVVWSEVAAVEDPVPGEEYTIWRCAARKNRLADGTPGPSVFDFEIRIQYEPMGPDDEDGTQTFTYGVADENERPPDDADAR
jgi:hypothetical protein